MPLHHAVAQWFIQRHAWCRYFWAGWLTTATACTDTGLGLREVRLLLSELSCAMLLQRFVAVGLEDGVRVNPSLRQVFRHGAKLCL